MRPFLVAACLPAFLLSRPALAAEHLPAETVAALLAPDKPATALRGALSELGIEVRERGPVASFEVPSAAAGAGFSESKTGGIHRSYALFQAADELDARRLFERLRRALSRGGRTSCDEVGCDLWQERWVAALARADLTEGHYVLLVFESRPQPSPQVAAR